jgi:hypothetical protein
MLLAAIAIGLGQALVVAGISALRPKTNIYKTIVLVAFAAVPAVVFADDYLFGRELSADGRLFLALGNLALGGFFFHFMTLPDRSVTLRILVELLLAPRRTLTLEELGRRYGVRTMIASRLEQLQDGRFLVVDPAGAIRLTPRGERFGQFVASGRRLFRIKSAN